MDFVVTSDGFVSWNGKAHRCTLGRSGIQTEKHEGDGATPAGSFPFRRVFYRPDRVPAPVSSLPLSPLDPAQGWCDDPNHPDYNRPVTLPHPASCETLWRDDVIYDLIVVLGHNDNPPVPGLGSAIFLHLIRADWSPTQGCVALPMDDLLALLKVASVDDFMVIRG